MISIIVPLYNYARYIEDNINSIQKQTYGDWELIIIDDCSSDSPYEVIEKYVCNKIKYIRLDENKGYSAAKNTGIRASQGEYIVVLDADDMLPVKSLALRYAYLSKYKKFKWIHGRAYEFSGDKPYQMRAVSRKATRRLAKILKTKKYGKLWKNMHAQTIMVHRLVYEKVGLYEESMKSMADKEMWARILHNIGIPAFINKYVAYYRVHGRQMHRSSYKRKNARKLEKKMMVLIKDRKRIDLEKVPTL